MTEERRKSAADGIEGKRSEPEMESAASRRDSVVKRWSARRKSEVVMRLLRGESLDAIDRMIEADHAVKEVLTVEVLTA